MYPAPFSTRTPVDTPPSPVFTHFLSLSKHEAITIPTLRAKPLGPGTRVESKRARATVPLFLWPCKSPLLQAAVVVMQEAGDIPKLYEAAIPGIFIEHGGNTDRCEDFDTILKHPYSTCIYSW